jgi:hypothetical protein
MDERADWVFMAVCRSCAVDMMKVVELFLQLQSLFSIGDLLSRLLNGPENKGGKY